MSELSILVESLRSKLIIKQEACGIVDEFSKKLAKEEQFRHGLPVLAPTLWTHLADNWKYLRDNSIDITTHSGSVMTLARFTRNLVAGIPDNQQNGFVMEPYIRYVIFRLTAFSEIFKENSYPLTRMMVQALSNIITGNMRLSSVLWETYSAVPEEQEIIARLLASPDIRTVNATLVLILNNTNSISKIISRNVLRILVKILDRAEDVASKEHESREEDETFSISYRIFENFFDKGLGHMLFHSFSIEKEPITPHQITLLKLLDSYFRDAKTMERECSTCNYTFLIDNLLRLSTYTQQAIKQSLKFVEMPFRQDEPVLLDLDVRLPKVAAALILLAQCVNTICVHLQGTWNIASSRQGFRSVVTGSRALGFIESLIETLRLLYQFLPRIVFGKAVPSLTTNGIAHANDTKGFTYLKRDLIRLVGTLCHKDADIQNRVRQCGGIPVVMNLCVIDEQNPYLQEHALFALRNVLYNNPENQAVVDALKRIEEKKHLRP